MTPLKTSTDIAAAGIEAETREDERKKGIILESWWKILAICVVLGITVSNQ